MMRVGVVVFPGSNCDRDFYRACQLWNIPVQWLWHKERTIKDVDVVVLPGGFSYGDYLRPGAIARFSPIMEAIMDFAKKGGYVWGICNGFQILTEANLLPGALIRNKNLHFICDMVYVKPVSNKAVINQVLQKRVYQLPIAHADGNYYCDEDTLKRLQDNDQILLQYCDADGVVDAAANPNGSVANIAGVCNEKGNVWGMMPHPERVVDAYLGSVEGVPFFYWLFNSTTYA